MAKSVNALKFTRLSIAWVCDFLRKVVCLHTNFMKVLTVRFFIVKLRLVRVLYYV